MATTRLLIALAVPALAFAGVDEDLAQAAKSPYDLAQFVNAHTTLELMKPLRKALSINEHLVLPFRCEVGLECHAELIPVDTLQVIVLLRGGLLGWEEVYLRYRRTTPAQPWSMTGYYSELAKRADPRHQLLQFGTKPYLLVTNDFQEAGVGWRSLTRSWLDLTADTFDPVFVLPIENWDSGLGGRVALHSKARIISFESQPVERIAVAYEVSFVLSLSNRTDELGAKTGEAVYTRRGDKFVFDASLSKTPEAEIDKLYNFEVDKLPSNEDFLRYLLPRLQGIASSGSAEQKGWLKYFLTLCQDTPEKREIQALLPK